ncbi:hypothetical protein F5I97DRAFT_1928622 [Phlebopus sp. FC_14]|nr:hypothetical protein F5I97DRAFT_1928622 [Phlebopus sp. FC_14]
MLRKFAIDACLVVRGVRSAYLVDAVYPPEPARVFSGLLGALRKKCKSFENVVFWSHIPSMQSFLVNVHLVEQKLSDFEVGAFIQLDGSCAILTAAPPGLAEVLKETYAVSSASPDKASFSLPNHLSQEILVPLAAVLIDYPVGYVPSSSQGMGFLGGETLDVYELLLKASQAPNLTSGDHILLKFSCPRALTDGHPELAPDNMMEKLRIKFMPRLANVGMQLSAVHTVETFNRVAL